MIACPACRTFEMVAMDTDDWAVVTHEWQCACMRLYARWVRPDNSDPPLTWGQETRHLSFFRASVRPIDRKTLERGPYLKLNKGGLWTVGTEDERRDHRSSVDLVPRSESEKAVDELVRAMEASFVLET